jgi:hypothetical protein
MRDFTPLTQAGSEKAAAEIMQRTAAELSVSLHQAFTPARQLADENKTFPPTSARAKR